MTSYLVMEWDYLDDEYSEPYRVEARQPTKAAEDWCNANWWARDLWESGSPLEIAVRAEGEPMWTRFKVYVESHPVFTAVGVGRREAP